MKTPTRQAPHICDQVLAKISPICANADAQQDHRDDPGRQDRRAADKRCPVENGADRSARRAAPDVARNIADGAQRSTAASTKVRSRRQRPRSGLRSATKPLPTSPAGQTVRLGLCRRRRHRCAAIAENLRRPPDLEQEQEDTQSRRSNQSRPANTAPDKPRSAIARRCSQANRRSRAAKPTTCLCCLTPDRAESTAAAARGWQRSCRPKPSKSAAARRTSCRACRRSPWQAR